MNSHHLFLLLMMLYSSCVSKYLDAHRQCNSTGSHVQTFCTYKREDGDYGTLDKCQENEDIIINTNCTVIGFSPTVEQNYSMHPCKPKKDIMCTGEFPRLEKEVQARSKAGINIDRFVRGDDQYRCPSNNQKEINFFTVAYKCLKSSDWKNFCNYHFEKENELYIRKIDSSSECRCRIYTDSPVPETGWVIEQEVLRIEPQGVGAVKFGNRPYLESTTRPKPWYTNGTMTAEMSANAATNVWTHLKATSPEGLSGYCESVSTATTESTKPSVSTTKTTTTTTTTATTTTSAGSPPWSDKMTTFTTAGFGGVFLALLLLSLIFLVQRRKLKRRLDEDRDSAGSTESSVEDACAAPRPGPRPPFSTPQDFDRSRSIDANSNTTYFSISSQLPDSLRRCSSVQQRSTGSNSTDFENLDAGERQPTPVYDCYLLTSSSSGSRDSSDNATWPSTYRVNESREDLVSTHSTESGEHLYDNYVPRTCNPQKCALSAFPCTLSRDFMNRYSY